MTIQELDNKVGKWASALQGPEMGNIMALIGEEALTRIKIRILNTGVDAEGQKYKAYSTKPMLAGCKGFLNQSNCPAKTKSKRRELKWVTIQRSGKNYHLYEIPGGYKEFRDMNLGSGHSSYVDFFFSGLMWASVSVVKDMNELQNGIVTIRSMSPEKQIILNANAKRRTSILKLSRKEVSELSEICIDRIKKLMDKQ
jgi:hypothetical protein